ncbi:MAG TPA: hypothetical protein VKZ43_09345, partial [Trueperaceae bacterium]|nr:hypothetical protein [Trueperaceae bacterium]
ALYHMISFSPYPHFFHVANVREYAPGRSILTDYLDTLFDKYGDYMSLQLRSPDWRNLGVYVADRTSHMHSGAMGVFDRTTSRLTLTAPQGGTVFVTGVRASGYRSYGTERISSFKLAPNQTVSVTVN